MRQGMQRAGGEERRGRKGAGCNVPKKPRVVRSWCRMRHGVQCGCVGKWGARGGACKKGGCRRAAQGMMVVLSGIKWLPGNAPKCSAGWVKVGGGMSVAGGWCGWLALREKSAPASGGPYLTPWKRERGWEMQRRAVFAAHGGCWGGGGGRGRRAANTESAVPGGCRLKRRLKSRKEVSGRREQQQS